MLRIEINRVERSEVNSVMRIQSGCVKRVEKHASHNHHRRSPQDNRSRRDFELQ